MTNITHVLEYQQMMIRKMHDKSFMQQYAELMSQQSAVEFTDTETLLVTAGNMLQLSYDQMESAVIYYFEPDVCDLIHANSETLENYDLVPQLFEEVSGMFYFPKSLRTKYPTVITWALYRDDGLVNETQTLLLRPEHPTGGDYLALVIWNMSVNMPAGMVKFPLGTGWDDPYDNARGSQQPPSSMHAQEHIQQFAAALAFLNTPVTVITTDTPPRAFTKRNPKAAETTHRVITLRRPRYVHTGEPVESNGKRTYTRRFTVREHWRNQYYATKDTHIPTLIQTYVKGPEGAPFLKRTTHSYRVRK